MVQSVLEQLPTTDVKVYIVWEPVLLLDAGGVTADDRVLVSDPRAQHFWTRSLELAQTFQRGIGLDAGPTWDVYLLFPPGVPWREGAAPQPADFMHQLPGRLSADRLLDASGLLQRIRALDDRPAN